MVTHQTLSPVESSGIWWNPVKSTGVRPESVGERQDLKQVGSSGRQWKTVEGAEVVQKRVEDQKGAGRGWEGCGRGQKRWEGLGK